MSDLLLSPITTGKNAELVFETIRLNELFLPDGLFDPSFYRAEDICFTHMPLIVSKDIHNRFVIIDGCKRYLYLLEQGKKEAVCGVLKTDSPEKVLLHRILVNRGRVLQFREKIQFLFWLKQNLPANEYREIIDLLRIDNKEKHELESMFGCSKEIVDAVDSGFVDRGIAEELNGFEKVDQSVCLELFRKLAFSRQTQRELIEWCAEIAYQRKKTIKNIFVDFELNTVLDNDKLNAPQKIKKIRELFYTNRYPNLTTFKKIWDKQVSEVNPDPSRVHFQHSEYFEKNHLEIKVTVNSIDSAIETFQKLGSILPEKWAKILYPG